MIITTYRQKHRVITRLHILLASAFFFTCTPLMAQNQNEQQVRDTTNENQVYTFPEEMPIFPGSLNAWIYNHVTYPETAKAKGIEGKVFIRFIIEKDGSVSDVKVIRGVSPELDNEAKEIISSLPKWNPGRQKGNPVRVYYTVPVYFALKSTSPSVERRTFDKYLKALHTQEEKLKNNSDSISQESFEMYRLYLKKRYGTDKAAYKGIFIAAKEQQQSTEIMLSIVMPTLSLPAEDKNRILNYYKEEWDEQVRLIDSLPAENFITEYVNITPRFTENTTIREMKIRDYLGLKKFKKYVEECIFSPGRLIRTIVANPLEGKWELVSVDGVDAKQSLIKEFNDDFTFSCSNGVTGTYKVNNGQMYSEHSESVKQKDILEYSANYQYDMNSQVLVLSGELKLKLSNGTLKNVLVKETWRRIE